MMRILALGAIQTFCAVFLCAQSGVIHAAADTIFRRADRHGEH